MATWAEMFKQLMARFDAIDAQLSDFESRLVTLEDRTGEIAGDLKTISDTVENLPGDLGAIERQIEELGSFDSAVLAVEELAEAERRRERLEWMAGARAAMGKVAS